MGSELKEIEGACFALFRLQSTPLFKRMVMLVVRREVEHDPRVTVNKLKYKLNADLQIPFEDTEAAVAALSQTNLLHGLSTWKHKGRNNNDVTHLNVYKCETWDNYQKAVLSANPELARVLAAR